MTQEPGRGVLTAAEKRLLRSLQVGDVVEVHRVERITVAERTEHGVFPCLIDSEGNIADDLINVRVITRVARPLEEGQVHAVDLPEHHGRYLTVQMPGLGPRRGRIRTVALTPDHVHVVVEVPSVTGLTDVVPVALGFLPSDAVTVHEEST